MSYVLKYQLEMARLRASDLAGLLKGTGRYAQAETMGQTPAQLAQVQSSPLALGSSVRTLSIRDLMFVCASAGADAD